MGNTCKIIDFNSDENEIETITFEKKNNCNNENSGNKKFYDKCDDQYDNVRNKVVPRRDTELYNRRKSKYDNGVVKVFLY